jgi:hypothetical protein
MSGEPLEKLDGGVAGRRDGVEEAESEREETAEVRGELSEHLSRNREGVSYAHHVRERMTSLRTHGHDLLVRLGVLGEGAEDDLDLVVGHLATLTQS